VLQCVAVCCSVLQCVAKGVNRRLRVSAAPKPTHGVAVCVAVCIAVCFAVCVAVALQTESIDIGVYPRRRR